MTNKEKIEAVKKEFPLFNKVCLSLGTRSEKTALTLVDRAFELIGEKPSKRARTAANRRDSERISAWIPEALRRKFNSSKEYRGYKTDHDYLVMLITSDAERIEKEKAALLEQDDPKRGNNAVPTYYTDKGGLVK